MPPKKINKKIAPRKPGVKHSPWLTAIARPFSTLGVAIPDDRTSMSGKVCSTLTVRTAFNALASTSTSHSFGILIHPYPMFSYLTETSAGNGVFTDVNLAGTAFIQPTATTGFPNQVPNTNSLTGSTTASIRPVSVGVRITYEGTELNRSGRFTAGLSTIGYPASCVATTGTVLSALSTVAGTPTATYDTIHKTMREWSSTRVSDGVYECLWKPAQTPQYQSILPSLGNTAMVYSCAAGVGSTGVTPSVWSADTGGWGAQNAQNTLVVLVDGDTTSAASVSSNNYTIEVAWNWEVQPQQRELVPFVLTESPFVPAQLQDTLNNLSKIPVGHIMAGSKQNF